MYDYLNQCKPIGYIDYFNDLIDLNKKQKLPTKIILSGTKGIGKSIFAKYFINFLLTKKINNFNYSTFINTEIILQKHLNQNFFHIELKDEKKIIEIDQVRNLISYSQKKPLNNLPRFILIDNIENLNKNAANALLKILEEPNDNMYFILIHDNRFRILETINSRCLNYKISFSSSKIISITNEILGININEYLKNNFINNYSSISDLITIYNFTQSKKIDLDNPSIIDFIKVIIDEKQYKSDQSILVLLVNLIEIFLYEKFISTKDLKFYKFYKYFTEKHFYVNKYNLDIETLFMDIRNKAINE